MVQQTRKAGFPYVNEVYGLGKWWTSLHARSLADVGVDRRAPVEIEQRFTDVLSEFARTLTTDFPIQAILDHLVGRIVDLLPVGAAGVTLIPADAEPQFIAASDEMAFRHEQLQTELGEGPCLEACRTGQAVAVPDLAHDDRFPRFRRRGLAEGLGAVFTFPLSHGTHRLGALDLYRGTPGDLDEREMAIARTLSDVAAAYLLNAHRRSALERSAERDRHQAVHDDLTGLPNRVLFLQRLGQAIPRVHRRGETLAVLLVDPDRFKGVNDTYGCAFGDLLLVEVAARLSDLVRPVDTVARLGGDAFAILCEDLDDEGAEALAARIGESLGQKFILQGIEVRITTSIGIATALSATDPPERVLGDADAATAHAKHLGGARQARVDPELAARRDRRAVLARDLPQALGRGQLWIAYQPIVATSDGGIHGAEALLRWDHPTLGSIAPDTIIPLAEHSGLIHEIGLWVLRQACSDRHRWDGGEGVGRFVIAVNVSARQLVAPGFAAAVAEVLRATGTEPTDVALEVTEGIFIRDAGGALSVLDDLARLGVILSLDDFGTGYSSLRYLKQFPVTALKIDRAFVADLGHEPKSQLIVSAIIELAHGLSMTVVAEGVGTAEQYEWVRALGCDHSQGYYFSRPVPATDLDQLMAPGHPNPRLPVGPTSPPIPEDRPASGGAVVMAVAVPTAGGAGAVPATKRTLVVLSHAMERAFDLSEPDRAGDGERGLVIALFQHREYFDPEATRYAALAEAGHTVIVGFAGSGADLPAGVHHAEFGDLDPRAEDWRLIMIRGAFGTALAGYDARDLSQGEATLEASRLFDATWTFRRGEALAQAAAQLARLAPDLPAAVVDEATGVIDGSRVGRPSPAENRLSAAADHLLVSVDSVQRRATRLRLALETTRSLAERDQLTGLNNRYFLERYLGSADRPADLVTMLVDIDDLKEFNDRHGHAAGDVVLGAVSAVLQGATRPGDVVVRWGGDEFLLLLPGLDARAGMALGQRILRAVRTTLLPAPWQDLVVSASIGVCVTRRTTLPLARLDEALIRGKRSGKGRAMLALDTADA
jgi:diguanylate cyclase (GGDEF)-like protein